MLLEIEYKECGKNILNSDKELRDFWIIGICLYNGAAHYGHTVFRASTITAARYFFIRNGINPFIDFEKFIGSDTDTEKYSRIVVNHQVSDVLVQ